MSPAGNPREGSGWRLSDMFMLPALSYKYKIRYNVEFRNQLMEDEMMDQMSIKEYVDPFTGDKNKKA